MSKATPLRIAWWSPLPPQESGISDYSYDLLEELVTELAHRGRRP